MFILAGVCVILAALAVVWTRKQHGHQRAETGRLLSMMCGLVAVLFFVGGFLKWGQH